MRCVVLHDEFGPTFICGRGLRPESRKDCAFCSNRATVLCDGARCNVPLCEVHRWSAGPELDFCPQCVLDLHAGAAAPHQIGLFA